MNKSKYTIGIGTYLYRFEQYFKPLMQDICRNRPDAEKIVFVNGQHKEKFNQEYRKELLSFLAEFDNVYVHISPEYRGCSHMWNTCVNMASEENMLFIADDNVIKDGFFEDYEDALQKKNIHSFSMCQTVPYSCFSICREDIKNVGYFDERLIGGGVEDGEYDIRYAEFHNLPENHWFSIPVFPTDKLIHHNESSDNTFKNTRKHNGKYSAFNNNFLESTILNKDTNTFDPNKFTRQGTCGHPVQRKEAENYGKSLYPAQIFFWENSHLL